MLNPLSNTLPTTLKRLTIDRPLFFVNFNILQELTIEYYSKPIMTVKPFGCIPVLRLHLKNLLSLDGLGYDENPLNKSLKNKAVTLRDMRLVINLTPLNGVSKVSIIKCSGFSFNDLGQLSKVKDLSITSTSYYENSKPLQASIPIMSERITLSGRIADDLLLYCPNVKELDLRDVSGDGGRSLLALATLKNLERLVIPSSWFHKVWNILNRDFMAFPYVTSDDYKFIYVRNHE